MVLEAGKMGVMSFFYFFSLDLLTAGPDVWYHSASFGEKLACQHDFRQVT